MARVKPSTTSTPKSKSKSSANKNKKNSSSGSSNPKQTQTQMQKQKQKQHVVQVVDPALLDKAVGALIKHHQSKTANANSLLGNDESIHVQFGLARIPEQSSLNTRPIRIDIPHSLYKLNSKDENNSTNTDTEDDDGDVDMTTQQLDEAEICLIVKDSSKAPIQELISQFPSSLSYIKKVLTLTSLRKKYAQYADKRTLCNTYTLFLVDDSILPMVGKCLGKTFFQKKKQPVPVKVGRVVALPFVIEKCVRSTFLVVGAGTCVSVKAASTSMSPKSIGENIRSTIENVIPHIPRKVSNILSISIKSDSSIALPIYNKVREELEEIAKLANVDIQVGGGNGAIVGGESTSSDNATNDTMKKKRRLGDGGDKSGDKEKQNEKDVEVQRTKKQKKEDKLKSPLLKALKKSKKKEADAEAEEKMEAEAVVVVQTNSSKKKKKKRTSSDADKEVVQSKDALAPTSTSAKMESTPKKKKKKVVTTDESNPPKLEESSPKKKTKKNITDDNKSNNPPTLEEDEKKNKTTKKDFLPSKTFKGAKKGYVFLKGTNGIGYYVDVKPEINKMAMAALARSGSGGGGGNKNKSRRQSTGKAQKKGRRKGRRSF